MNIVGPYQTPSYSLRRSRRARRLSITISRDGRVVVVVPLRVSDRVAYAFVRTHEAWIVRSVEVTRRVPRGRVVEIPRGGYPRHKEYARGIIRDRLDYFAAIYGYTYNRLSIRDQKTRWGSCSEDGNINVNYKVAFMPEEMRDYVIVHELCHLKELNHSPRFWALVAECIPDHKKIRKELTRILFQIQ